jgi:hypothetical protein
MGGVIPLGEKPKSTVIPQDAQRPMSDHLALPPKDHHVASSNSCVPVRHQHLVAIPDERKHALSSNKDVVPFTGMLPCLQRRLDDGIG